MNHRNALRSLVASTLAFAMAFSLVLPAFAAVPPAPPLRTVAPVAAPSAVAPITPNPADTGLVIVKPKASSGLSLAGAVKSNSGTYVLKAPAGRSGADYAAELARSGNIEYAAPNYVRHVTAYTSTPNDPDFKSNSNWLWSSGNGLALIGHMKSWWVRGDGSSNFDPVWPSLAPDGDTVPYHARASGDHIKVAVIDTGFYMDHPDKGNVIAGKDCFSTYNGITGQLTTDNDVTPDSPSAPMNDEMTASHGTMVASEIAQAPDNGIGGTGAAYDTQVRVYKVQGIWVDGQPTSGFPAGSSVILDNAIIDAIVLATDDGCRVISMSLGGSEWSPAMQAAIDYAYSKGVVVVAATGNDNSSSILYPGGNEHVMGVGSYALTGGDGLALATTPTRSSFSNYGYGTDIMAPGSSVWGPARPGYSSGIDPGYLWWSGTSMATPLVAAAAALTFRFAPNLSPDQVVDVLQSTATDMGATGRDDENGWGKLDMAAAYARLKSDYPNLAKPNTIGITDGAYYTAHDLTLAWSPVQGQQVTYGVTNDWGDGTSAAIGNSASFTGIPDGTHTVVLTPTSPLNWNAGSAVKLTFTVGDSVPDPPATPVVSYDGSTRRVSWVDTVTGSHTTQVAIDSVGSPATVTGTSYTIPSSVPDGPHTAYVRMVDGAGTAGAWGTVSFTVDTKSPLTPLVSWDASARRVVWTDSETGVHVTEFALDDIAAIQNVTGTSRAVPSDIAVGTHSAFVRIKDAAGNASGWGIVKFTITASGEKHYSEASLSVSSAYLSWGAKTTISGTLAEEDGPGLAGQSLDLEGSTDGGRNWTVVRNTTTSESGQWSVSWAPGRNWLVRASYNGNTTQVGCTSPDVSLRQYVYLGTPSVPSHAHHGRSFTTYGYLKPQFTAGTHPVKVYFYRYEKHGHYRWVLRKTVYATAYNRYSYTKYSVKASLPYTGRWKAVTVYAGSSTYTKTTSGHHDLRVY